jgi:hypothetical protein
MIAFRALTTPLPRLRMAVIPQAITAASTLFRQQWQCLIRSSAKKQGFSFHRVMERRNQCHSVYSVSSEPHEIEKTFGAALPLLPLDFFRQQWQHDSARSPANFKR